MNLHARVRKLELAAAKPESYVEIFRHCCPVEVWIEMMRNSQMDQTYPTQPQ